MRLTAFIVDDEPQTAETLQQLIQQFCPEVKVLGIASNITEAIQHILAWPTDILFLDINLGNGTTGFDLLDTLYKWESEVVFVSAYEEYGVKAFQYSAIHYLLKPISHKLLIETVHRIKKKKETAMERSTTPTLRLSETISPSLIMLSDMNKTEFIPIDDIVYLESNGSYTIFHLKDKRQYTKSKNLKYFEDALITRTQFIRTHKSFIINKHHIKAYNKNTGELILTDGIMIPMSIGYKSFIEQLGNNLIQ